MKLIFISQPAGNLWQSPDGWEGLHPQLNLNLDDQTPYLMHNGAMHIATQVNIEISVLWVGSGVLQL